MDISTILETMSQHGMFFLAAVIFLEYLNLPGFPAGVILPVAGMWAATSKVSFLWALLISVGAAVVASWVLYFIGLYGGEVILSNYIKKFPKHEAYIKEKTEYLRKKGNVGVMVCKLIPMVRTIISIPAGVLKLNFIEYTIYSAIGIAIWNGVLIATGYFLGERIFEMLI